VVEEYVCKVALMGIETVDVISSKKQKLKQREI